VLAICLLLKVAMTNLAHYLGMIGIRPDEQGRGIGRRLIDAVKDRARSYPESTGITLNTECESNLLFYEKVGFLKGSEADVVISACL
jgi:ribosomal protein S18 acetylase RimI-like enzyme